MLPLDLPGPPDPGPLGILVGGVLLVLVMAALVAVVILRGTRRSQAESGRVVDPTLPPAPSPRDPGQPGA